MLLSVIVLVKRISEIAGSPQLAAPAGILNWIRPPQNPVSFIPVLHH